MTLNLLQIVVKFRFFFKFIVVSICMETYQDTREHPFSLMWSAIQVPWQTNKTQQVWLSMMPRRLDQSILIFIRSTCMSSAFEVHV